MPLNIVLGFNECFPCLKIPSNTAIKVLNNSTAGDRTSNYNKVFNKSLCCLGKGLKRVTILSLTSYYFTNLISLSPLFLCYTNILNTAIH